MQQIRCINCMKEITQGTRICPHCGYDQQADLVSHVLRPNTILHGRYLVGRVIGKGGFGITYVGFDLMLEVKVAIKEYYPSGIASRNNSWSNQVVWESQSNALGQSRNYGSGQGQNYGVGQNQNYGDSQDTRTRRQESMERVLKEARRTAKLSDVSAIVSVHDVFQENETAYIVMEFIEGITLKEYLMQHGVMSWDECKTMLFPVMDALAQAHDLGIIHRDISPDNIMVRPNGTVKLLDLGAATDVNANEGHASTIVVKNHFSALEQYDENGKIGSHTDVYAFAAMLYYCLTGKLMTPVLDRMRNPEIVFTSGCNIPEQVKDALRRALAIYEDERTRDMREFQRALTRNESEGTSPEKDRGNSTREGKKTAGATENDRKTYTTSQTGNPETTDDDKTVPWNSGVDDKTVPRDSAADDKTVPWNSTAAEKTETGQKSEEMPDKLSEESEGKQPHTTRKRGLWGIAVVSILLLIVLAGSFSSRKTRQATETENSGSNKIAYGGQEKEKTTEVQTTTENDETTSSKTIEKYTLMSDEIDIDSSEPVAVFGSEYTRDQIVAISFLDSLESEPKDSWDVSEDKDGSIKAWVEEEGDGYHLFVASEGEICAPENSRYLFAKYENCTTIGGMNLFDTSLVTDMRSMFSSCRKLTELDVSGFNTSQVTDMKYMFSTCWILTELDVSGFDTMQVTDMTNMFSHCNSLTELDVSGFDTTQVTHMTGMFCYCSSLTELDVSGFDTLRVTKMYNMFLGCTSLTSLTLWPDCSDSLREEFYEEIEG